MTEQERTKNAETACKYGLDTAKQMAAYLTKAHKEATGMDTKIGPAECMGLNAWVQQLDTECKRLRVNRKSILRILRGTK